MVKPLMVWCHSFRGDRSEEVLVFVIEFETNQLGAYIELLVEI